MSKNELRELIDKVRNRHNSRIFYVLALLLALFIVGLAFAPHLNSDLSNLSSRKIYFYCVFGAFIAIGIAGGILILQSTKTDCIKLKVLCPKCGLSLYPIRRLLFGGVGARETGICPHCHCQFIDKQ